MIRLPQNRLFTSPDPDEFAPSPLIQVCVNSSAMIGAKETSVLTVSPTSLSMRHEMRSLQNLNDTKSTDRTCSGTLLEQSATESLLACTLMNQP